MEIRIGRFVKDTKDEFLMKRGADYHEMIDVIDGKPAYRTIHGSGSGKSSLLGILGGNINPNSNDIIITHSGIQLGTEPIKLTATSTRRKIAFVSQYDDGLVVTATPRETIRFSARLRNRNDFTDQDIDGLTQQIIKALRLEEIADTPMGNGVSIGVSGGERRRISLGIELVVCPSIVLLDEVTSGLDGSNAMQVIDVLKRLSRAGTSTLLTVHQPNSQMFSCIDNLMLLHRGRMVYQGPAKNINEFFTARGCPLPPQWNPADWMLQACDKDVSTRELERSGFFGTMDLTEKQQQDGNEKLYRIASKRVLRKSIRRSQKGRNSIRRLSFFPSNGDDAFDIDDGLYYDDDDDGNDSNKQKNVDEEEESLRVSMVVELCELFQRSLRVLARERKILLVRSGTMIVGSSLIVFIFAGTAKGEATSLAELQAHAGTLFLICVSLTVITQIFVLGFIEEVPIFVREYLTSHYTAISYAINKCIIDSITTMLQVLISILICFWGLGLQGRFWYELVVGFVYCFICVSVGFVLALSTRDTRNAKEILPVVMLPQMLFSGFFVPIEQIPIYLRWVQWILPLPYVFRLLLNEELAYCKESLSSFSIGGDGDDDDGGSSLLDCMDALQHAGELVQGDLLLRISGNDDDRNTAASDASTATRGWFNESSRLTVAQVGTFQGIEGIAAYGSIFENLNRGSSCLLEGTLNIVDFSYQNGICDLTIGGIERAETTAETTLANNTSNDDDLPSFRDTLRAYRIQYQPLGDDPGLFIQHVYVYYPDNYFDLLHSNITVAVEAICDSILTCTNTTATTSTPCNDMNYTENPNNVFSNITTPSSSSIFFRETCVEILTEASENLLMGSGSASLRRAAITSCLVREVLAASTENSSSDDGPTEEERECSLEGVLTSAATACLRGDVDNQQLSGTTDATTGLEEFLDEFLSSDSQVGADGTTSGTTAPIINGSAKSSSSSLQLCSQDPVGEITNSILRNAYSDAVPAYCLEYLEQNRVGDEYIFTYWFVLIVMIVVSRLVATLLLRRRAQY